jgi:hypothetical protein
LECWYQISKKITPKGDDEKIVSDSRERTNVPTTSYMASLEKEVIICSKEHDDAITTTATM